MASSTVYTEGVHLRNLAAKLGHLVDAPADRVGHCHLEQYLQDRLGERSPTTVDKQRVPRSCSSNRRPPAANWPPPRPPAWPR